MHEIKLVIFDMDGLLFDTEKLMFSCIKKTMNKNRQDYGIDDFKDTIGLSEKDINVVMNRKYGNTLNYPELKKEISLEFRKQIIKNNKLSLKKGALSLLNFLKHNKIKMCIASSSKQIIIKEYIQKANIEDFFSLTIGGDQVKESKPSPEIFEKACYQLNVSRENTIILEDSLNGFKAASSANIKCIIIPDMFPPHQEMIEGAFKILPNLEGVKDIII